MATSHKRNIAVSFAHNSETVNLTGNQAHQFINQYEGAVQIITVFEPSTKTYKSYNRDCICNAQKVFSNGDAYVKPTCEDVF